MKKIKESSYLIIGMGMGKNPGETFFGSWYFQGKYPAVPIQRMRTVVRQEISIVRILPNPPSMLR